MQIDVIEDRAGFEALREQWEAARRADPDGHFFLSFPFMDLTFERLKRTWRLLVARVDGRAVAFLPLRVRGYAAKEVFATRVEMPGRAVYGDYTGLVCAAEHEEEAIPALAAALQQFPWAELDLENWMASGRRTERLLAGFDPEVFDVSTWERKPDANGVNNDICPWVELADTFDAFAEAKLSANTRQRVRRFLRKVTGEVRITEVSAETYERDLGVLLEFWRQTWGPSKPDIERKVRKFQWIFRRAFDRGRLYLPILWRGERPLAANGYFVDPESSSILFKITGRDEAEAELPVGIILHGHAIHWAIGQGLRRYDFVRGNETYKYSFGASDRRIRNLIVRRRSGRNPDDRLDPLCLDEVVEEATELLKNGKLKKAGTGFMQVTRIDPRHPGLPR